MKLTRWMALLSALLFSVANGLLCNQLTGTTANGREEAKNMAREDSLPFYILESENEGSADFMMVTTIETIGFASQQVKTLEEDCAEPVLLFPNVYVKTNKKIPYVHEFEGEEELNHYSYTLDQRITDKEKAHFPSEKYQIALSSDTYDAVKNEIGSNNVNDVLGKKWGIYTITSVYQSDTEEEERRDYLPQLIVNKAYSDHDYGKENVFLSRSVKMLMKKENKEKDESRFQMIQKKEKRNTYQVRAISKKDNKILSERNYFEKSQVLIIVLSVVMYVASVVLFFVFIPRGENLLLLCLVPFLGSLFVYSFVYLLYSWIFSLFLYPYISLSVLLLAGSSLLMVLLSLLFKRKKGVKDHEEA